MNGNTKFGLSGVMLIVILWIASAAQAQPAVMYDNFNNADNWSVVSGTWSVTDGVYFNNGDPGGISLLNLNDFVTSNKTVIETDFYSIYNDNYASNAAIIFDYQNSSNFKFVIANIVGRFWRIRDAGANTSCTFYDTIFNNKWYRMRVVIDGTTVSLSVKDPDDPNSVFIEKGVCNNVVSMGTGKIGLRASASQAQFDNFLVRHNDSDSDGYTPDNDCNDNDPSVYPGAIEVCDAKDNDCNSQTDDGLPEFTYYRDADGDGYGDPVESVQLCAVRDGYADDNTDCNEMDKRINPGAREVLNNVDDDCNPATQDNINGSPILINSKTAFHLGTLENLDVTGDGLKLDELSPSVFYESGSYVSPVIDTGQLAMWNNFEWYLDYGDVSLVKNHGFETDAGSDGIPDDWTGYGTFSIDSTQVSGGIHSLKLIATQNGTAESDFIDISNTQTYHLSNDLKIDMTAGDFYVQIELYDSNKQPFLNNEGVNEGCCKTLTGGWYRSGISEFKQQIYSFNIQELIVSDTIKQNTKYIKVVYKWWSPAGTSLPSGTAWIDNVTLQPRTQISIETRTSTNNIEWSSWSDRRINGSGADTMAVTFPAGNNVTLNSDFISIDNTETYTMSNDLEIEMTHGDFYVQVETYDSSKNLIQCCQTLTGGTYSSGISAKNKTYVINMNNYNANTRYIKLVYKWWTASGSPSGTAYIRNISLQSSAGQDMLIYDDYAEDHFVMSPQGRYIQYKIKLRTRDTQYSPVLNYVSISYSPASQFAVQWNDVTQSVIDSDMIEAPAGNHGFISVGTDGHFYFNNCSPPGCIDKIRAKFWGVQIYGAANFPTHEQSTAIAKKLRKLGFNAIKFQIDDNSGPGSIFLQKDEYGNDVNHTQQLDPIQLDKLDFFISKLKEEGIYVYMRLQSVRSFKPGDNVEDLAQIKYMANYVTLFDQRLIELQKDYAKKLLEHYNRYTEYEYKNDPAILFVELTNENSIMGGWLRDELDGTSANHADDREIPASYARKLDILWNQWLMEHYSDRSSLDAAWGNGTETGLLSDEVMSDEEPPAGYRIVQRILYKDKNSYTDKRVSDLARFYNEIDATYYKSMRAYLKGNEAGQLNINQLIVGTNNYYSAPSIIAQAEADFVDTHLYWDLPNVTNGGRKILNRPMVMEKNILTTIELGSASKIAGKPLTVTEWNHTWPNQYRSEQAVIFASYMALQDWDASFLFTYNDRDDWTESSYYIKDVNINVYDPTTIAQMPVASRIFLRGDVRPALQTIDISYTEQEAYDSVKKYGYGSSNGYSVYGHLSNKFSLIHKVQTSADYHSEPPKTVAQYGLTNPFSPYVSDTRELSWDTDTGIVTVNTDRTQSAVGFVGGNILSLRNMTVKSTTPFCAISLTSLDDRNISYSGAMLMSAAGRSENTNQHFIRGSNGTNISEFGLAPVLTELIEADIVLNVGCAQVYALDETGHRKFEINTVCENGTTSFSAKSEYQTLWYEISRDIDADDDGHTAEVDCNDSNPAIHPGAAEICNGVDDNCNGQIDEGYAPAATSCGVGVCTASGQYVCQSGTIIDTCTPGSPTGTDDNCNGIDENCDGTADNNYVPTSTSCGVGACSASGNTTCVAGVEGNTCTPGAPQTEICDGTDNDCNGIIDEGFDADGDGYTVCGGDCNDGNSSINPSATEIPNNGIDDDCNPSTPANTVSGTSATYYSANLLNHNTLALVLDTSNPEMNTVVYTHFHYDNTSTMFNLQNDSAGVSIIINGNTSVISGTGTALKVPGETIAGCTYTITLTDASPDIISLEVRKPDGSIYYSSDPHPIDSGDFVVTGE